MDECVKIVRKDRQSEVALCVYRFTQAGRSISVPSNTRLIHPLKIAAIHKLNAVINFAVGNNSIGIRSLFLKIWCCKFSFCDAAYNIYVINRHNLRISSLWWTLAYIPTTLCRFFLVSFLNMSFILLHCSCRKVQI